MAAHATGSAPRPTGPNPIPAGATLLHIGLSKTGSTALQYAASASRADLARLGVRYPGTRLHHRIPFLRLIETGGEPPVWRRLAQEVDQVRDQHPTARVLLSAESASGADRDAVARIVDRLGEVHIAVALRAVADRVPSVWQQRVRNGNELRPLDEWVDALLDDRGTVSADTVSAGTVSPDTREQAIGVSRIVDRWAAAVGPEHVTAIVVDRAEPGLLYDAFERLLALPAGTLAAVPLGAEARVNRGMTAVEIEFARQVRLAAREAGASDADTASLLHRGGFLRVQSVRTPPADEARILLREHAADRLVAAAAVEADAIAASGVAVVGDLGRLAARPPVREHALPDAATAVPADLAIETVLGVLARATGRDHLFRGTDAADAAGDAD